jgi:hypothetical protein
MMEALVPVMAEILREILKQVGNELEALAYEYIHEETESVMGQRYEMIIIQ